jgi:integrase
LVMGDVIENGQHVPLAERVWDELCGLVPFELVALEVDHYDESAKTTRVWGEKRKGRATPKDRVIVFAARAFAQDGGGAPVFAKRA